MFLGNQVTDLYNWVHSKTENKFMTFGYGVVAMVWASLSLSKRLGPYTV